MATYLEALAASLRTIEPKNPADVAICRLAWGYAERLDTDPESLAKVGPLYKDALTALFLTPAARAAATKGVSDGTGRVSPLDELRARRANRMHGAPTVDTATG